MRKFQIPRISFFFVILFLMSCCGKQRNDTEVTRESAIKDADSLKDAAVITASNSKDTAALSFNKVKLVYLK